MSTSADQLRTIIERIEKLEADKADVAEDIKQVYAEAKSNGFDVKIIRKVVAIRKKEESALAEEQALLSTYLAALGMLSDLPLGQAALKTNAPGQAGTAADEASKASVADLERARQKGEDAAEDGWKATDNPYIFADPRYQEWAKGFSGARVAA